MTAEQRAAADFRDRFPDFPVISEIHAADGYYVIGQNAMGLRKSMVYDLRPETTASRPVESSTA